MSNPQHGIGLDAAAPDDFYVPAHGRIVGGRNQLVALDSLDERVAPVVEVADLPEAEVAALAVVDDGDDQLHHLRRSRS